MLLVHLKGLRAIVSCRERRSIRAMTVAMTLAVTVRVMTVATHVDACAAHAAGCMAPHPVRIPIAIAIAVVRTGLGKAL